MNTPARKRLYRVGVAALAIAAIGSGGSLGRYANEPGTLQPQRQESEHAQVNVTSATALAESIAESGIPAQDPHALGSPPNPEVDDELARRIAADEAAVRKNATQQVKSSYALLLGQLELTSKETDALLELLIDYRIAGTWTRYKRGEPVDRDEQSRKIAAVIGDGKLQHLRALEQDLGPIWEADRIGALLQRQGAPLTDAQRSQLLPTLIQARSQYGPTMSSYAERRSIEHLEYRLSRMAEYQRHILELVPSMLSPQQVIQLDKQYQHLAYRRAQALEQQKQMMADNPGVDAVYWYPAWTGYDQ